MKVQNQRFLRSMHVTGIRKIVIDVRVIFFVCFAWNCRLTREAKGRASLDLLKVAAIHIFVQGIVESRKEIKTVAKGK